MDFVIGGYLVAVNLAGLLAMWADKRRAVRGARRVPERALMLLALAGGSFGALCGMLLCRHKTQKPKFYIGLPLLLAVQIATVYFIQKVI